MRPVADLAAGLEEEARGWRIRPSAVSFGGSVLDFFLHFFVPGVGGFLRWRRGGARGAALEAEVLGGEFGPRTPLCSMEQRHGGELCSGEEDGFDGD